MKKTNSTIPDKIKLSKVKILKKIDLKNIPLLIKSDFTKFNSQRIPSIKKLNTSRKLKKILNIRKLKIKEELENNKNLIPTKLISIKSYNLLKNKKSFGQMAKEVAEKNMTHYLSGYYDIYDGAYQLESDSKNDNYIDNNDSEEISEDEKNNDDEKTIKHSCETKRLKKNYSQDFINIRNKVLKDEDKIQEYEKLLLNNKINRVKIQIKNKDYKNLLSSYNALSQNRLVYDNILNNYKGSMISQYAKSIDKLNPIIKIHEKNIKQNIRIFPTITKSLDLNYKNDYLNENESLLDSENNNITKDLNEKIFNKVLLHKRNRLYLLKNSYQYPIKNFPGSLSEFAITQNQKECILFGGHNSGKNPNVWRFNGSERSWDIIKADNSKTSGRFGHTAVLKNKNLYIFGGVNIEKKKLDGLEIFNFDTKKWTIPTFNTKYILDFRKNHVACSIGNCMFIQGGIDEQGEYLNDCFLLNYQPLQWRMPLIGKSEIKIPSLAYHSCCLVLPEEFRKDPTFTLYTKLSEEKLKSISVKEIGIYIFGGKTSKNGTLNNNLYVLKIGGQSLEWIILNTYGAPPKKRYGASMSFYEAGNILIIHGGRQNTKINFAFNDTFILNLYSLNWMKVEYFDNSKNVAKRYFHQSFVDENFFYVFGGMNESNYLGSEMFILDLASNKACVQKRQEYNINEIIKKSKNTKESLPPIEH